MAFKCETRFIVKSKKYFGELRRLFSVIVVVGVCRGRMFEVICIVVYF